MKFKLSTLGYISLALYVIFNIWSSTNTGYSQEQLDVFAMYGYGADYLVSMERMSLYSMIVSLLSIIPSIDFFIKAFKKHARGEEYAVSTLSIVLTVLTFGIPFLAYGFVSFVMKKAFGSEERLTSEKWGLWILSIFTFGIVWIIYIFSIGPAMFVYRTVVRDVYKLEDSGGVEITSLILATIFTLGFVWLFIGIGIVFSRFFFIKAWNKSTDADVMVGSGSMVWFWILSVLSLGILPLSTFITYWTFELFINNAEDLVV